MPRSSGATCLIPPFPDTDMDPAIIAVQDVAGGCWAHARASSRSSAVPPAYDGLAGLPRCPFCDPDSGSVTCGVRAFLWFTWMIMHPSVSVDSCCIVLTILCILVSGVNCRVWGTRRLPLPAPEMKSVPVHSGRGKAIVPTGYSCRCSAGDLSNNRKRTILYGR
jgi:hypothetical protein